MAALVGCGSAYDVVLWLESVTPNRDWNAYEVGWSWLLLVNVAHPLSHDRVSCAWDSVWKVACLLSLFCACGNIHHRARYDYVASKGCDLWSSCRTVVPLGPLPTL